MLTYTGMHHVVFGMLAPWLFVVGGFAALYLLLAAHRIPLAAAAIGAVTGGTLWLAAAAAYGWYARSTVYYANIYGSLAAIPIFIFWLYLSWLLVFIGAQVGFAWQNLDTYREELLSTTPSQRSREQLALRILGGVARRWLRGAAPATAAELAAAQRTSARAVNEAVGHLIELGMLADVGSDGHLMLCTDPHRLSPSDVLDALRGEGGDVAVDDSDLAMHHLSERYAGAVQAARAAWRGVTFADLLSDDEAPAVQAPRDTVRGAPPWHSRR
jgi:membrane protein